MSEHLKKIILNFEMNTRGPSSSETWTLVVEMSGGRTSIDIPGNADAADVYLAFERLGEKVVADVQSRGGPIFRRPDSARPNVANCKPESP